MWSVRGILSLSFLEDIRVLNTLCVWGRGRMRGEERKQEGRRLKLMV